MIVSDLKLPLDYTEETLKAAVRKKLRAPGLKIRSVELVRRSIDARKKPDVFYHVSAAVNEPNPLKIPSEFERLPLSEEEKTADRVVVAGSGPAGLFAALTLVRNGIPALVLERGEEIEKRTKTVETFFETGRLDPESNVQFGEGGAGTFSDGKLTTGTHRGRLNEEVFKTFYQCGAGEEILYDAKPHIGTDRLRTVIRALREEIIRLGGEFRFSAKLTGLRPLGDGLELTVNETERLFTRFLVLAIGHSARDTFELLKETGFQLEKKAFAVGVRIEHPQRTISEAQYGPAAMEKLPAAPYKLVGKGVEDRGVYSFCMCPGGYVVNASSEEGLLAVNGMSDHARDGVNANSAIVVQVRPEDFPEGDVLSGIRFQRDLEEKAYRAGNGRIPVQRFEDFLRNVPTVSLGSVKPEMKGAYALADLNPVFPAFVSDSLKTAIPAFSRQIQGFDDPDALLSAVESRTSSPVRILRSETMESSVPGVYPAGEGAGYAGGIVSSASDGIAVAESIVQRIRKELGLS
ncbi:MAG: FAD-dependent oxidoreductase [Lachnospiraceae bacterium]|nr:FAD-dependent oxidoreductase [Lachnospiraceae bacterium]